MQNIGKKQDKYCHYFVNQEDEKDQKIRFYGPYFNENEICSLANIFG